MTISGQSSLKRVYLPSLQSLGSGNGALTCSVCLCARVCSLCLCRRCLLAGRAAMRAWLAFLMMPCPVSARPVRYSHSLTLQGDRIEFVDLPSLTIADVITLHYLPAVTRVSFASLLTVNTLEASVGPASHVLACLAPIVPSFLCWGLVSVSFHAFLS